MKTLIPYWSSLDSVRIVHSRLEGIALGLFALLVLADVLAHLVTSQRRKLVCERFALSLFAAAILAEIVAYPYGQRNDALSALELRSLDTIANDAVKQAAQARFDAQEAHDLAHGVSDVADAAQWEAADAEIKLASAQQRTARLEAVLSWRTVSPDSEARLKAALLRFPHGFVPLFGMHISITFENEDPEAREYAKELAEALDGFGAIIDQPAGIIVLGDIEPGLSFTAKPGPNPKVLLLLNAMKEVGLDPALRNGNDLRQGDVGIFVGHKPRGRP